MNRSFTDKALKEKLGYNRKSKTGRENTYQDHAALRADPKVDKKNRDLLYELHDQEALGTLKSREAGGKIFEKFARQRGQVIWTHVMQLLGAPLTRRIVNKLLAK